jgi:proteasome lid subunit RPN8/RPN11
MCPTEVVQALDEFERDELSLLAIVHSHPEGPATPSDTDIREFHYPAALMVIADLSGKELILRAWRVDPFLKRFAEVGIDVGNAT